MIDTRVHPPGPTCVECGEVAMISVTFGEGPREYIFWFCAKHACALRDELEDVCVPL